MQTQVEYLPVINEYVPFEFPEVREYIPEPEPALSNEFNWNPVPAAGFPWQGKDFPVILAIRANAFGAETMELR